MVGKKLKPRIKKQTHLGQDFEKLLNVGIALSSIHELDKLLDLILKEARRLTRADAGTLYLVKDNQLIFKISQCDSLCCRLGEGRMRQMYESFSMPISPKSIAGYVALNKKVLNISDVQQIPEEAPFQYNPSWDEKTGYITRSMLVVPMLNREGKVTGVLQLINATEADSNRVCAFEQNMQQMM
jgi:GAF domain-containing protein